MSKQPARTDIQRVTGTGHSFSGLRGLQGDGREDEREDEREMRGRFLMSMTMA